ncbi:helix-turn-helix domain-containing protein [Streptomyces sp. NPDC013157]
MHVDTVRCWRGRFAAHGLGGLSDRERSGAMKVAELVRSAGRP